MSSYYIVIGHSKIKVTKVLRQRDFISNTCSWFSSFVAATQGGYIALHVWEIVGRKNIAIFKAATILDFI